MSDTDPSETGAESVSFGQNSELSSKCFLLSGLSVVATCTADISKTFSASELKLHVFLSYTVINSDCSVQANLTVDEHSQVECEDYITELTITVHDVLNGIGRIEISKSITGNITFSKIGLCITSWGFYFLGAGRWRPVFLSRRL